MEYLEQCRGQIQQEEMFMFDIFMEPVKRRVLQVTNDFGGQSEALAQGTERERGGVVVERLLCATRVLLVLLFMLDVCDVCVVLCVVCAQFI